MDQAWRTTSSGVLWCGRYASRCAFVLNGSLKVMKVRGAVVLHHFAELFFPSESSAGFKEKTEQNTQSWGEKKRACVQSWRCHFLLHKRASEAWSLESRNATKQMSAQEIIFIFMVVLLVSLISRGEIFHHLVNVFISPVRQTHKGRTSRSIGTHATLNRSANRSMSARSVDLGCKSPVDHLRWQVWPKVKYTRCWACQQPHLSPPPHTHTDAHATQRETNKKNGGMYSKESAAPPLLITSALTR